MKVYSTSTTIAKKRRRIGDCPLHLREAYRAKKADVWQNIINDVKKLEQ